MDLGKKEKEIMAIYQTYGDLSVLSGYGSVQIGESGAAYGN